MAEIAERKQQGRPFAPGQSGNPSGRPPGTGKVAKLRDDISKHVPDIIKKLVEMAKSGDAVSARLLLERVLPPMKAIEQAVELQLPEGGSLTAKADAVLSAVAAGVLAPSQAAQLITALGTVAKITEIDELETRIAKLESANANAK